MWRQEKHHVTTEAETGMMNHKLRNVDSHQNLKDVKISFRASRGNTDLPFYTLISDFTELWSVIISQFMIIYYSGNRKQSQTI